MGFAHWPIFDLSVQKCGFYTCSFPGFVNKGHRYSFHKLGKEIHKNIKIQSCKIICTEVDEFCNIACILPSGPGDLKVGQVDRL